MTDQAFTIAEAVQILDPPITASCLRERIRKSGIEHVRMRYPGTRGRPVKEYSLDDVLRVHAGVVRGRPGSETGQWLTSDEAILQALESGSIHVDADEGAVYRSDGQRAETPRSDGYGSVWLSLLGGGSRTCLAHRVVWLATYGSIPRGFEINHRNGRRWDNRLCNLEAVSHANNQRHGRGLDYFVHAEERAKPRVAERSEGVRVLVESFPLDIRERRSRM